MISNDPAYLNALRILASLVLKELEKEHEPIPEPQK
jgi:hypothetical protein